MSKNTTIRFALGTKERPGSAVWRVVVKKKVGDIYIHNNPQVGSQFHVALHASGKFHAKLGNERYELAPPWEDSHGLLWGPIIFFYNFERNVKPPMPTGNTELIHWLGWPDDDSIFIVKPTYTPVGMELSLEFNEKRIAHPVRAKVLHKDMDFHLFIQHRPMSEEEKKITSRSAIEPFKVKGQMPTNLEVVRMVKKTELGPSAIILERFHVEHEI